MSVLKLPFFTKGLITSHKTCWTWYKVLSSSPWIFPLGNRIIIWLCGPFQKRKLSRMPSVCSGLRRFPRQDQDLEIGVMGNSNPETIQASYLGWELDTQRNLSSLSKALSCIHVHPTHISHSRNIHRGTFLVVQWLRLHAPTAGGTGLTPGWGIKIAHAVQDSKKRGHL